MLFRNNYLLDFARFDHKYNSRNVIISYADRKQKTVRRKNANTQKEQ